MATKPTAKKQPFVIEPLNWVAPSVARDESDERKETTEKPAQKQEDQE
ncbi:hypothetical protein [Parapusillimonas granuli]|uniref:Uncharacterized protein n=1 Tax=Parapusillimonas granuli TaxID=380911 RepID=A0A853G775_9BURK|nr:hypothetical protein [Parapusillimonas granuli]MBB5214090.1 hypothetical protein [Parapusillimonas granuli]MEB2400939.1 hypothetical protein [Alcaligenaceae bacterium]NYT50511.1 hypothetical protein [Parapusillimonas granuli]